MRHQSKIFGFWLYKSFGFVWLMGNKRKQGVRFRLAPHIMRVLGFNKELKRAVWKKIQRVAISRCQSSDTDPLKQLLTVDSVSPSSSGISAAA
ncbi:hypothetical protein J1N35_018152 [Gossypium stocksii]|uniref:Uncharacterized protein n=1 Tax=Gossypium stocksii TaxID=47602 RepID=A0A9D4A6T7_9ROSI|nr:hypothetical protein J1N35_018152 [Gossypium stocksii]